MMKPSLVWTTAVILIAVLALFVITASKKSIPSKEGWSQFECGFNVMNPAQMPFSFQFFVISLLFLIFDIEIALVLSYPLEPNTTKSLSLILSFIIILTFGLMYEWQKSKIKWSE